MKKPTEDGMRYVVLYAGKIPNKMGMELLLGIEAIQCVVTIIFGYNEIMSFYVAIPQMIAAVLLLYFTDRVHLQNVKHLHLLNGLNGLLLSIGCGIGCFFMVPLEEDTVWKMGLLVFVLLAIGSFCGILHDFLVARGKSPILLMIGGSLGSGAGVFGAMIGLSISRNEESINLTLLFLIFYILLVFASSFHTMFLMRSYYANVLEKMEKERTRKRRMACRH